MIKVGITGGIGSGKSTVCRLFARRGVPVYDSDREAKRLMAEDVSLQQAIMARFGTSAYVNGVLDRKYLAERVFGNPQALAALNALVHPAVVRDFAKWTEWQEGDYVILESAILFEAGLESMVDRIIAVLAPEELRVERACRRDGTSEEAVRRRIAVQMSDDELRRRADYTIVNILEEDLEFAVDQLDQKFHHETLQSRT